MAELVDAKRRIYPGELASPCQVLLLAEEFQRAALTLKPLGARGKPLSWAPFRLSAIHAIELFLNAFLLQKGLEPAKIRGLQHDLGARADLALANGLKLRVKTAEHLHALRENREYLVTRYGPEMASTTSQLNRLEATLNEIAKKVAASFPEAV